MGTVSYIPLGEPFLKTFVTGLIRQYGDDPAGLMNLEILLPTRRTVRMMTDLFLDTTDGRPLLLPKIRAVADMDDEALEIMVTSATGHAIDIPPVLSPIEAQLILTEMIRARDTTIDFTRAVALAQTLLAFLKSVRDEGLTLDSLDHLVDAEFAAHWQITLDFLNILRTAWPGYVHVAGRLQAHDRRILLFEHLITHWQQNPPAHPVMMAGVTGSLPIVAKLMEVVANLPQGHVILPGLDPDLPDDHRKNLTPQDPQYELNHLLENLNINPTTIPVWDGCTAQIMRLSEDVITPQTARRFFTQHMMCPGACTPSWANLKNELTEKSRKAIQDDLSNIKIIQVNTALDEAHAIAAQVRIALTDPATHIAIVTPDRSLATLIMATCLRFNIEVNDSAGNVLYTAPHTQFLTLILTLAVQGFSPVDLIALLRHPFLNLPNLSQDQISLFECQFLRGVRPPTHPRTFLHEYITAPISHDMIEPLTFLVDTIEPLYQLCQTGGHIHDFIRTHLTTCEKISTHTKDDISALWIGDDGEALSHLCTDIINLETPPMHKNANDYTAFMIHLFKTTRVNRRGIGHPRVQLLGVYESRLMGMTHVILAGFNEGIWPIDPGIDPWLARTMRADFGMPPAEQEIGRLSHDVVQLLHVPKVTITYRMKMEGAPALPSRWLHRFYSVITAIFGPNHDQCQDTDIIKAVHLLDAPNSNKQQFLKKRPAPCPPQSLRPTTISSTQIETLMIDPYAFYAQKILRLKPLDPLDLDVDDRIRGIILHRVLDRILRENRPQDFELFLTHELDKWRVDQSIRAFMMPRLSQTLRKTIAHDFAARANGLTPDQTEQTWTYTLPILGIPHHITARLDRLDRMTTGGYAIIDYKTGASLPTRKNIDAGLASQLVIQSLCVQNGLNENKKPGDVVSSASFWHLKPSGVKVLTLDQDQSPLALNDLCDAAQNGLVNVLSIFAAEHTPYYPVPDGRNDDLARDTYDHLSRRQIWWGLDDDTPQMIASKTGSL